MPITRLKRKDAKQLVIELRRIGLKEDAIYSRLISEGFAAQEVEKLLHVSGHQSDDPIQRNDFLSGWLILHKIIVIPSIFLLIGMVAFGMAASSPGAAFIFTLLLVDACIQLWLIEALWNNNLKGFYGLMILFVLRFFLMPPLNLIDAILLCIAVYTSKRNAVTGKSKRKRKLKA